MNECMNIGSEWHYARHVVNRVYDFGSTFNRVDKRYLSVDLHVHVCANR